MQLLWNTGVFIKERWEAQRWLIVGVFGLLFLLLFLIESLGLFRLPGLGVRAVEALPSKSAILIEVPQVRAAWQTVEQRNYQGPLEELRFLGKWLEDLRWLDSTFQQTESFKDYAEKAEGWSALRVRRIDEIGWLHVWQNEEQDFDATLFLAELAVQQKEPHRYRGKTLWEVQLQDGSSLSWCWTEDLLLLARNAQSVEAGISQLDDLNSSLSANAGFSELQGLSGSAAPLSLYVNLEYLPLGLSVITPQNFSSSKRLKDFSSWMNIDVRFDEDFLIGTGYSLPQMQHPFIEVWMEQPEVRSNQIPDYIPRNAAIALSLVWEDGAEAYRQLKAKEATSGNLAQREDFERHILPWLGDEVCLFITEPTSNDFETDRFTLVEMKDARSAERLLQQLGNRVGFLEEYRYQNFDIKRLRASALMLPFLGEEAGHLLNPHYLLVDNYVLFANSRSAMELWVDQYNFAKTVGKMKVYQPYAQQWRKNSNAYLWIQTPRSAALFKSILRKDMQPLMEKSFESWTSLSPLGLQWAAHQGRLLTTLQLGHQEPEAKKVVSVAWRCALKADAATPPFAVRNSKTGQLQLLIQDKENRLYCMGRSGQLLWERELPLPILSGIQEIDFHGDGSIQYLFSTKDQLYLLNAEGADAQEIYPRKLNPPTTNGATAVDYGQGPHIFLANTENRVYGYDKYGKPLEGWSPLEGLGRIVFPLQHHEWKGEDYFMLLSQKGSLYLLDRNGRMRHRVAWNASFTSTFQVDIKANRIAASTSDGRIKIANFQGKRFDIKAAEGITKNVRFAFADIIGDERKDYLRLSNKELALHYYDSTNQFQEAFRRSFDFPLDAVFPVRLQDKKQAYIGCYSKKRQSLYLLDSLGQNLPAFPLVGTSPFVVTDWFDLGENTLLVANRNSVYAYKLR